MPLAALALAFRSLGGAVPGIGVPELEATRTYGPDNMHSIPDETGRIQGYPTYAYSVHVAGVEIELDTGVVHLRSLAAVHDCGTLITPDLAEAQLHGAIAMGVGVALTEEESYGPDGRPLAVDFKRYLLPRIKDLPRIATGHLQSPSPFTAMGTKGAGESGVGGAAAAIVGAIRDAVGIGGTTALRTPLTPPRVLELIDSARAGNRQAAAALSRSTS
jgi:aerobic carbon-monoxide dehydrogenase large subunit